MTLPVVWRQWAFTGPVRRTVVRPGTSIAELVAGIPEADLPVRFHEGGQVQVNGVVIPRDAWEKVRLKDGTPKAPIVVTLHAPPLQGGGSGAQGGARKNPAATVAGIALLVVTSVISAGLAAPLLGSAFAAGTWGSALLSAGVGIAGSLAIQALFPPPAARKPPSSGDDRNTASAEGNVVEAGGPIPRVLGTHKVFPPLACHPFRYLTAEGEETVEAAYCLTGPHALSDIRIAGAPIASDPTISYETREGWGTDTALTLVTKQVLPKIVGEELSRHQVKSDESAQDVLLDQTTPANSCPRWHTYSAAYDSPNEIWFRLTMPSGLYDGDNTGNKQGLPLRFQFRRIGDPSWINGPELHFWSRGTRPLKCDLRFKFLTASAQPQPPTNLGPALAYISVPAPASGPGTGWTADAYFDAGGGGTTYYSNGSFGAASRVRRISLNQNSIEVFLGETGGWSAGPYEFRFMVGMSYGEANFAVGAYTYSGTVQDFFTYKTALGVHMLPKSRKNVTDALMVEFLQSIWNTHPIPKPGLALIALRAKRPISQVSAVASGYVPDWNGTAWANWTTTSNPAPHLRYARTGDLNADPVATALLDDAAFLAFRSHAATKGYTCNAILEGRTLADAAQILCGAAYARPVRSDLWGVILDKDRSTEAPVQVFTPRNMANFRWKKAFTKRPHGLRVKFFNSAKDYTEDEVIVLDEGVSESQATRLEEVTYEGMTTVAAVTARAQYDLKQSKLRSVVYTGEVNAQFLVCRRGDLVAVEHDILDQFSGRARVLEVLMSGANVVGLYLDSEVPVTTGGGIQTGAAMRLRDGTVLTKQIVDPTGDRRIVTFATPFALPTGMMEPGGPAVPLLDADCLVTVGRLGSEYRRLLLAGITPGADLTATLTFVDEAPGLWT